MKAWQEEYKARYQTAKERGKPFFPHAVAKDALVSLLILAALCYLAARFEARLEPLADPSDSTYNPRPEWYFLFLFQALKAFPGSLEAVAAVVLPGAAVAFLFLLPLLDRGPRRHPLDRPLLTGAGVAALAAVAWLTAAGLRSPLVNPTVEKDPLVAQGTRLYRELNCAYCHSIGGKGGSVGPALDMAAGTQPEEWIVRHFRDPQSVSPGSRMPKLNLLEDEIRALTAFVLSLGIEPHTKEAPKLFAEQCAVCHRVGGEGGDVGPDLSAIGSAREKNFIKNYIADPTRSKPDSTMPGFKAQLTDVQIEDIARYLSGLGR